jgi:hypothetical protein
LGKFATVFQSEIHAILQRAYENIRRAYKNKQILIFSDSQAALKALSGPKVTSRLVAGCLDALLHWQALMRSPLFECQGIRASLAMNKQISLLDKRQPRQYLVQSQYLSVCQEKQLRTGLSTNTLAPGKICQVADTASFS